MGFIYKKISMKKTFIFYTDWIDYTEEMTNEEKWILFQAILDHENWKPITNDNIVIRMIFPRIKKQLDEDKKKWQEEKKKRSEAGKKWMKSRWWVDKTNNNTVITNNKSVIKDITKITDNDNVNVNDNVNDINNNNTIVLEQAPVYWNNDINDILERIKIYNNWIIDWTVKEQRRYWKLLLNKVNKIESVENWKYSATNLLDIILNIVSKSEYHSHKIVWPKKIYYELAWLMQICKQDIQKEKWKEAKEF